MKLSPGRREAWREGVCNIWVYFLLLYSDFIGNELN